MEIDSMTIGQLKQINALIGGATKPLPFKPGEKWLIRCVTNYIVGEIAEVVGDFLVLSNASWASDTGRFSECMASGTFAEVEHQEHRCVVNTGAIVDAFEWAHKLPEATK